MGQWWSSEKDGAEVGWFQAGEKGFICSRRGKRVYIFHNGGKLVVQEESLVVGADACGVGR